MELSELRPYIDLIRSYPYKKQELIALETQINETQAKLNTICKDIKKNKEIGSGFLTKLFSNTKNIETLQQQKSDIDAILKELYIRRDELKGIIDYINGLKTQFEKLLIIRENEFRGDIYHSAFPRFIEIDTKIEESKVLVGNSNLTTKIVLELIDSNNQLFDELEGFRYDYDKTTKSFIDYDDIKIVHQKLLNIDIKLDELSSELKILNVGFVFKHINSNILREFNYTSYAGNNSLIDDYQTKLKNLAQNLQNIKSTLQNKKIEISQFIVQLNLEKEDILINA